MKRKGLAPASNRFKQERREEEISLSRSLCIVVGTERPVVPRVFVSVSGIAIMSYPVFASARPHGTGRKLGLIPSLTACFFLRTLCLEALVVLVAHRLLAAQGAERAPLAFVVAVLLQVRRLAGAR